MGGCQDGLEPRPVADYGVNPEFLKYHIDEGDLYTLERLIIEDNAGKGTEGIYHDTPLGDCKSDTLRAIYTLLKDFPDFTPEFTTFTFGGTMADMPPLRDKDGNPNMEFFRAWKQKTEDYYYKNYKK